MGNNLILNKFTDKFYDYLIRLDKIKTHISIQVLFPEKWVIPKIDQTKQIEVFKSNNAPDEAGLALTFVFPYTKETVDSFEVLFDNIVIINKQREEKRQLFNNKVNELKKMFESKDLNDLKHLRIQIDDVDLGDFDELEKYSEHIDNKSINSNSDGKQEDIERVENGEDMVREGEETETEIS